MFRKSNVEKSAHPSIDSDGLPHVGQVLCLCPSISFLLTSICHVKLIVWLSDDTTRWTLL